MEDNVKQLILEMALCLNDLAERDTDSPTHNKALALVEQARGVLGVKELVS